MKKFVCMLLAGAFIMTTIGCGGDAPAPKAPAKDKEAKKEKDKA